MKKQPRLWDEFLSFPTQEWGRIKSPRRFGKKKFPVPHGGSIPVGKLPEEWIRIDNTHEPLFAQEIFNGAKGKTLGRKRDTANNFVSVFSGLVKWHIRESSCPVVLGQEQAPYYRLCGPTDWEFHPYEDSQTRNTITAVVAMAKTIFEQLGGRYERHGDYLIPCLILPAEKEELIGLFGQRHLRYRKEWHRVIYTHLLINGRPNVYLTEIDKQAQEHFERLIEGMK